MTTLPDVESFLREIASLAAHPEPAARTLFDPTRELLVTRAPGRLDLMGGIADYSGSLVLQWPLREATLAALQLDPEPRLRVVSLGADVNHRDAGFEIAMDALLPGGRPLDYDDARAVFARDPRTHWAAYVLGTLVVLARERSLRPATGLRLLIRSDVPEGKGVSSSAALEVAAMHAMAVAYGIALEPRDLAVLCQKVENLVVGAPCGVMDQMTSACGRAGELLVLLCQPAELLGTQRVPDEVEIWGIDSHERHAVSGSDYGRVRVGAFMGARILEATTGLQGYLANVTPDELAARIEDLPETMTGSRFLERHGRTADTVTRVDPALSYAVRQPTSHPVHEHARVQEFAKLLAAPVTDASLERLGELMYQSHASYSACGLGSVGTDRLVALVKEAGPRSGLYGAKITGGGSGGTVAVLGRSGADVRAVASAYARETGQPPRIFSGSSPGAAAFGHVRMRATRG
ncbi:MAG TPA: GHMP kinase [Vicinamibacteria bacterium]|nr:GHMP kinase [Vicinamibacteria bacterium]